MPDREREMPIMRCGDLVSVVSCGRLWQQSVLCIKSVGQAGVSPAALGTLRLIRPNRSVSKNWAGVGGYDHPVILTHSQAALTARRVIFDT